MKNKCFILIAGISLILNVGCEQKKIINETSPSDSTSAAASEYGTQIKMDGELPSKESIPALFDQMDFQQATQCYLGDCPLWLSPNGSRFITKHSTQQVMIWFFTTLIMTVWEF